jgi:lipopolysaccharide/colanic/teichoic acid biosynthesis glycosyltransferase
LALEGAYSDVPGFTSDEQTFDATRYAHVADTGLTPPHLIDLTVLEAGSDLWGRVDRVSRRALDVLLSLLFLILTAPLFAFIWLAIRLDSPGAAIYRHKRLGRDGQLFECLKFRTMVEDADTVMAALLASDPLLKEEFERSFKLKDDPRITPIGRFLRRTSLDELPQFINVLQGDMSVVGPRPIVEEEAQKFGPDLKVVLSVRPGITGLWQISGRNDLSYDQRVALDRRYVLTRTIGMDIAIMARTPVAALRRGNGAY